MTDKQDPIAHAARLLREAAEELRQAQAYSNSEGWENETDAKAADIPQSLVETQRELLKIKKYIREHSV